MENLDSFSHETKIETRGIQPPWNTGRFMGYFHMFMVDLKNIPHITGVVHIIPITYPKQPGSFFLGHTCHPNPNVPMPFGRLNEIATSLLWCKGGSRGYWWIIPCWLVVEPTHLKNMSQNGNLPQLGMSIKKHLKPPPISGWKNLGTSVKPVENKVFLRGN